MSESNILASSILKWHALALKRLTHLDELQRTGRWQRHFPNEQAFKEMLRTAYADAERWKQLAEPSKSPITAEEGASSEANTTLP
jgi:hypothetical protein